MCNMDYCFSDQKVLEQEPINRYWFRTVYFCSNLRSSLVPRQFFPFCFVVVEKGLVDPWAFFDVDKHKGHLTSLTKHEMFCTKTT